MSGLGCNEFKRYAIFKAKDESEMIRGWYLC
jgi:hypothetical protein